MARRQLIRTILVVGSFTTLLTFLFYLAHDPVPNLSHRLGWQAFDSILLATKSAPSTLLDIPAVAEEQALPSYPLDTYAPLLLNPAPLTAIQVLSCLPLASCVPKTTPEQDAKLGKWVRIDRSLDPSAQLSSGTGGIMSNLFGTLERRFIFYRKSRRYDVPRVVEIKLVESGDEKPKGSGWHRTKYDLRGKYLRVFGKERNLHLYYRTVGGEMEENDDEIQEASKERGEEEAITEIDLVYGDNPPWPGFSIVGVVSTSHPSMSSVRVSLSVRRTPKPRPSVLPPTFGPDGTFKVLQLADLHFSVTPEPCRDATPTCVPKNDTLALVEKWLDEERPDMVVFSGDQLNGQSTSWDERSVLSLWTKAVIDRKIPWAAILGNHDSESGRLERDEQMRLIQNMPYSLSMVGPATIDGAGNYYVKVNSPGKDRTHLATLWFFDSGTKAPPKKWKPWEWAGYSWVRENQVDWWKEKNARIAKTLRPYKLDGAEDLGPQWKRWDAGADQGQLLKLPPSLMFMHIPVPEAFAPADLDDKSVALIKGVREETATFKGAQSQPGIFDAILQEAKKEEAVLHDGEQSVRGLFHGHMHLNEDCRRVRGVWICFGGGSSFEGYGKKGFMRRARIIEFSDWAETVKTWHRLEKDDGKTDEITF